MQNDRFQSLGDLGHGRYSRTCRALDSELNRVVALKLIALHDLPEPAREARCRTAQAMARLDHPSIAKVWLLDRREDELRIALQLLHGKTLDQVERPIAAVGLLRIAQDLCAALTELHQNGLVHGRLAPRRVMLQDDGRAVLLDFSANALATDSADNPLAAPETSANAAPTVTGDVFSLGRLLQWLAQGSSLPAEMRQLLDRATTVDPGARIADMIQFAVELGRVPPARTWRTRQHRRLLATGLLTLAVGAFSWALTNKPAVEATSAADSATTTAPAPWGHHDKIADQVVYSDILVRMPWRKTFAGRKPAPPPEGSTVLRVPEQYASVQLAYDAAPDGAYILLQPGSYRCTSLLANQPKLVTIQAVEDASNTMLTGERDPNAKTPVVMAEGSGCRLRLLGLTIAEGTARETANGSTSKLRRCSSGIEVKKGASVSIIDCIVCSNGLLMTMQGAAFCLFGGKLQAERCLIVGNLATYVPIVFCSLQDGHPTVGEFRAVQCTFSHNINMLDHADLSQFDVRSKSLIELDHCVVWGNSSSSGVTRDFPDSQLLQTTGGILRATNCILEQMFEGEGNLSFDPQFRNPEAGDFRLREGVRWANRGCFPQ
jgi:hypothetical protein